MRTLIKKRNLVRGFTLIEVIVTITIAAILASFLVTFMGTGIIKSSDPVYQAKNLAEAESHLEKISAFYNNDYLTKKTITWSQFTTGTNYCKKYADCSTITVCSVCIDGYETIEASITIGNQKLVAYFIQ